MRHRSPQQALPPPPPLLDYWTTGSIRLYRNKLKIANFSNQSWINFGRFIMVARQWKATVSELRWRVILIHCDPRKYRCWVLNKSYTHINSVPRNWPALSRWSPMSRHDSGRNLDQKPWPRKGKSRWKLQERVLKLISKTKAPSTATGLRCRPAPYVSCNLCGIVSPYY